MITMKTLNKDIQFLIDPGNSDEVPEWEVFEKLVYHHRYYHTLELVLKQHSDDIPAEIRQRLKTSYQIQLQKQLLLANELQILGGHLNRENLHYLSPKGTALAIQLYGDIGLRLTRDIDLLIHEEDLDRIKPILKFAGYQIIPAEESKPEKYFRRIKKNYTFINRDKNIILELHWSLFSNRLFYPHEEQLTRDPENIKAGNILIPTMNRENHFIYLILHGILHQYFRLFWLRDIHEAVNHWDLDWDKMNLRSKKDGIQSILHASLLLSSQIFGTYLPVTAALHDKKARQIADHVLPVINRSSLPEWQDRLARVRYFMSLRNEPGYKIECVAGVVKRYFVRV